MKNPNKSMLSIKESTLIILSSLIGAGVSLAVERFVDEKWSLLSFIVYILVVFIILSAMLKCYYKNYSKLSKE